jgi:tetratricopeptide (TPR) repeat protein/outer membrane protein assembly factor BamB
MDLLKLLDSQTQKKAVGTLTLGKKHSFRELFFEGDSIYVVGESYSGKIHIDKLLAEQVIGRRIGIDKLEGIIARHDLTRQLLPQVLHEQGVIDEEELRVVALSHLIEESVDLLSRNSGSFHFQEGRVPEYLLKYEAITVRVPLPIVAILQELRRRTELMDAFHPLVPSLDEVFVVTEKGMAFKQEHKNDFVLKRILDLIDGFRSLRSLIQDSRFYEFHVISWIVEALEQSYIKKTILPELKGVSTHNMTKADAERYVVFFKNAVKHGVDELAARERLAAVYERAAKAEDAVIQYNFIGDALYRMKKPAKAIKAYQRALLLKPGEILITDKITKIYREASQEELANGNVAQAIQLLEGALRIRPGDHEIFTQLLALLIKEKKLKELSDLCDGIIAYARKTRCAEIAIKACQQVIRELPRNAAFRKKLINLYLDFDMNEEAVAEMEGCIEQYLSRGQVAKAEELVEKMRRSGVPSSHTRSLRKHVDATSGRAGRRQSLRRPVARTVAAIVLGLAIYQAWTFKEWTDIRNHYVLAEAVSLEEGGRSSLLPDAEERRSAFLARECDGFLHSYPLSFFREHARNLSEESKARSTDLKEGREARIRQVLKEAGRHLKEGKKAAVESLVSPLLRLEAEDPFRQQAEAMIEQAGRNPVAADELLAKARSLEIAEDWKSAYRAYRQVLEWYPESKSVKDVKLPVTLQSLPRGAEVREVKPTGDKKLLGKTPIVVSFVPGRPMEIEMSSPGFHPTRAEIQEIDGHEKQFVLPREREWVLTLDGPVEIEPTFQGSLLLCGTSKGSLVSIDATKGKVLWTLGGSAIRSLVSAPVVTLDGTYTVWNNGKVVRLPASSINASASAPPTPSLEYFLGSLAASPLHEQKAASLLVLGTKSRNLQAYDQKTGALAWSLPIDGLARRISDLDGDILVTLEGGTLLRVRTNPPSIVWRRQIGSGAEIEANAIGKTVTVVTKKNDLIFLKASDGVTVLAQSFPLSSSLCVAPAEEKIFLLDKGGELFMLSPESGSVIKAKALQMKHRSVMAIPGGLAVVLDDKKSCLLVNAATAEPLWVARVAADIRTVAASESVVVIVAVDGTLTAFRR